MASPSLSSPNPTLLLLSFGSIHLSVLSVFMPFHVLLLCLCLRSPPLLPFFALHPFSPPSHRCLSFPSILPLSPRAPFQFPSAWTECSLLRSLLGEFGELKSAPAEEHHTRTLEQTNPFSCSNFNCVLFATCICLYLLQIPELICARSLESITRTGLTSYVSQHQALRDKPRCSYLNQLLGAAAKQSSAQHNCTEETSLTYSHICLLRPELASASWKT